MVLAQRQPRNPILEVVAGLGLQPLAVLALLVEPRFLVAVAEAVAAARQLHQPIVLVRLVGKTVLAYWTPPLPHSRAQEHLLAFLALAVVVVRRLIQRHHLAAQAASPAAAAVVVVLRLPEAQQPQAVLAALAL